MNIHLSKTKVTLIQTFIMASVYIHTLFSNGISVYALPFTLAFFLYLPGYFISKFLDLSKLKSFEKESLKIILSLAVVMFVGLVINTLGGFIGIDDPLSRHFITISIAVFNFVLFCFVTLSKDTAKTLEVKTTTLDNLWAYIFPVCGLIITILSINSINYLGSNSLFIPAILVLIISIGVALYLNDENLLVTTLFVTAFALICMYSLRSNYPVGYDINQEIMTYRYTQEINYWDIQTHKNPYNSCLSINILPTIISNVTGFNILVIFKLIYPLLLSLAVIFIYSIGSKYLETRKAFLGTLFYIIQLPFILQIPALARQEIAYVFFILTLFILFSKKIHEKNRDFLFILSTCAIVISHYSTTYIAIFTLLSTYIISKIISLISQREESNSIKFVPLMIILVFTVFWNSIVSTNSNNLVTKLTNTFSNMGKSFFEDNKSEFISKAILFENIDQQQKLDRYYIDIQGIYGDLEPEKLGNYVPLISDQEYLEPVVRSSALANIIRLGTSTFFRISLVIGLIICIFKFYKKEVSTDFMTVCAVLTGAVLMIILLPGISLEYNFERIYQQALVVLIVPFMFGVSWVLGKIRLDKTAFIAFIIIAYLFVNIGIIDRFFLGTPAFILDNLGEHYDRYYIYPEEVRSTEILQSLHNNNPKVRIKADRYSLLRFMGYSKLDYYTMNPDIFPQTLKDDVYIYASGANVNKEKTFVLFEGAVMSYNYPMSFVKNNKNLIYTNGKSEIFR